MENAIIIYEVATERFFEKFDNYWSEMLKQLGSEQAQLVIGNRLRPQICLWGYLSTVHPNEIASHDFGCPANIAVSIEMVHKASLLLDDWIDGDAERHGKPAFHIGYGPQHTVLFALNMIGLAMLRLKDAFLDTVVLPHHYTLCLNTLIRTIYAMAKGALEELSLQKNDIFNNEKICQITQLETAEIIGNSMLLGYYAGVGENREPQVEQVFKKLGDQCGYLFQALNDLEAFGGASQLKSHKGSLNFDYSARRKNLAISALYELANKRDKAALECADDNDLLLLMKKYRIVDSMKSELSAVYANILSLGASLQTARLPIQWCEGLQCFLGLVKKYAEERLKE